MKQKTLSNLGVKSRRFGFALFIILTIISISLLSYSASDNCLNVVGNTKMHNLLGYSGAVIADILYQYFGFSIFGFLPILFYLSIKYILKQIPRFVAFKIIYTTFAVFCLSFVLGCFTKYQYYFTIPLGGRIGLVFSKIFPVLYLKIFAIFCAIFFILFCPYITFIFGAKSKKQLLKEGKSYGLSMFIYDLLMNFGIFFKTLLKTIIYPFKVIKNIHVNRKNKATISHKNKKVKIETNEKQNNINFEEKKPYNSPIPSLLKFIEKQNTQQSNLICKENMQKLSSVLGDFGVRGDMIGYKSGPIVTLYEFKPQAGIKASRVIGLCDDIARTMMVSSVRIATISGRDTLGIEVPNQSRETVCFRRLIESQEYQNTNAKIPMILGCNIFGKPIVADLTDMPHLLIAGTTGSGKSVGINGMILSMLYKLSPEQCRFIMIDPKMLEFSVYSDIPHLMLPVVTDAKNAVLSLKWVVREMENRYKMMSEIGVRNIVGYNEKAKQSHQKAIQSGKTELEFQPMQYIVVVIDEMADLMVVAGKEIEVLVQRLSQMARAAGIHLIMATQRPSVDVITGVIKSNFPTRISYRVTSKIDSRTILGEHGAEQLLGKGDLLFMIGGQKTLRVHGPFISDDEVENVVSYLKKYNNAPEYIVLTNEDDEDGDLSNFNGSFENDNDNALYKQAVRIVLTEKKTSISYLQRKLRIGYNKSANFIEKMEEDGILSSPDHTGKRMIIASNNDD